MKTYVITLSKYFLANHKRAGEETHFKEKFLIGQGLTDYDTPSLAKIHTIRANYPLWEKRIKEVQEGRTTLSIGDHICQYASGKWQVYGSAAAESVNHIGKYRYE